jgi:hypothetical protein
MDAQTTHRALRMLSYGVYILGLKLRASPWHYGG